MTRPSPTPDTAPRSRRGSWWSLLVLLAVVWGGSQALGWWRDERAAALVQAQAKAGDILMFTTSTCPYCEAARQWMTQRDVPFQECNVDTNPACQQLFQARGAPGVPLLRVRGQWRLGFDPLWVGEALQTP